MQCYNPRLAFRSLDGSKIKFTRLAWSTYIIRTDGTYRLKPQFNTIFSNAKNTDLTKPLKIPCSKCDACVLNRAGETARRAYDEFRRPAVGGKGGAQQPPKPYNGMFLTLTYDDQHLPKCGHFDERDIVLFVKRLRKILPCQIRTLGVAEYGERTGRAHFHLLVFGYQFPDKKILRQTDSTHSGQKYDIFESKTLQKLWDKGISEFGTVTEQSCSYVARYLYKKTKKTDHGDPCENCQNEKPKKSKIVCRSRRPGLGSQFCDSYIDVSRASRSLGVSPVVGNDRDSLPRYYIDRVRKNCSDEFKSLLETQPDFQKERSNERKERLDALKLIDQAKLKNLKRKL